MTPHFPPKKRSSAWSGAGALRTFWRIGWSTGWKNHLRRWQTTAWSTCLWSAARRNRNKNRPQSLPHQKMWDRLNDMAGYVRKLCGSTAFGDYKGKCTPFYQKWSAFWKKYRVVILFQAERSSVLQRSTWDEEGSLSIEGTKRSFIVLSIWKQTMIHLFRAHNNLFM